MATEYPPLGKSFVSGYANNDRDYPIISIRKDPRVDNYKIPEDLSPHPDSTRYPNHIFTGARPTNSDERVQWDYEILPAPWVPFTRYDDDLGPIQGRRRAVKNEGQRASLATDKKVTYEGRDGSAIVSLEIEETWSTKTDEDGNSLFPIKTRDFYDASRGAVQEIRQIVVPTGEEEGSIENINGTITQTSYEPYNEFLLVKIVQTYSVSGPQLIGKTTDNDGQLATVTTQRKGALNYIAPNPTATRTVEVSREDAESLVERIVDTPEVFAAKSFSAERPDVVPTEFRDQIPTLSDEITEEGTAQEITSLIGDVISKSEQQVNKFLKRTRTTTRSDALTTNSLEGKIINQELGAPEIVTDSLVAPTTSTDTSGLFVDDRIDPLSSTLSRRVRRELESLPSNYIYYEVTDDQVVVKNEVSIHRRDTTNQADPTYLSVPVIANEILDVADTPLGFPWVRRVTKRLPTNELGELILPPNRTEYDDTTYTFPGVIYTWKAKFSNDQVRANLSFFENRYPITMTVAARFKISYHLATSSDPNDDPDLNLSNPAARDGFDFFRVITRPWARIFFNIPDNTIHPPAPITIAKESVERGGIAFDIQGGQASEPSFYTAGEDILIGGSVKRWWGNVYKKTLVFVREPV
jgi:hypothetical protein